MTTQIMKAPTHRLTITVPLNCDPAFDYNPLEEFIKAIMPITKLGLDGAICGDVILSIAEVMP